MAHWLVGWLAISVCIHECFDPIMSAFARFEFKLFHFHTSSVTTNTARGCVREKFLLPGMVWIEVFILGLKTNLSFNIIGIPRLCFIQLSSFIVSVGMNSNFPQSPSYAIFTDIWIIWLITIRLTSHLRRMKCLIWMNTTGNWIEIPLGCCLLYLFHFNAPLVIDWSHHCLTSGLVFRFINFSGTQELSPVPSRT